MTTDEQRVIVPTLERRVSRMGKSNNSRKGKQRCGRDCGICHGDLKKQRKDRIAGRKVVAHDP